jgi:hypothetical protein
MEGTAEDPVSQTASFTLASPEHSLITVGKGGRDLDLKFLFLL